MNKNLSEGNMGERNFQKGKNKLRIVAILAAAVILLVQGTFFYSLLFQYDTYGMPSSYEYYISFDEWLKMIDQAQTMKHTWFLDNTIGINEASVIAMTILFAVLISLAKGCQVRLRGIKQTIAFEILALVGATLLIRLTADQFRLYMNFKTAEVTALVFLVFIFINRKTLLWSAAGQIEETNKIKQI